MRLLLLIVTVVGYAFCSFCGDSAIPYSFEALTDGQPVLGCARPTCFGWNANGEPATHNASFYRINRKPDGFLRKNLTSVPPFHPRDIRYYQTQTANCQSGFESSQCDNEQQWVGGIAPLKNVSAFPMILQCCSFEPLRLSSDRGIATVTTGQIVVGGEVYENGRQYGFDYISDVHKTISRKGEVSYEVSIRRLPCLPLPDKHHADIDFKAGAARAFQDPTAEGGAIPLPDNTLIEGPFPEDVVVEEIVAQPGVEITPNNPEPFFPQPEVQPPFPQPPPQPQPLPPQPQPVPQQQNYYYPPAPRAPVYYSGGGGTGTGSYYCFTADTQVKLIDGKIKRMDELAVDDWVQTTNETHTSYGQVTFWLHRMPKENAEFLKLQMDDGSSLKLTGKHYIYRTTCTGNTEPVVVEDISREAVFADTLNVGDCVYRVVKENHIVESRVEKISKVTERGVYAPMTTTGRIIVNNVLASCHNVIQSHTLQNSFFTYVDQINQMYTSLFGKQTQHRDLPFGLDIVLAMMEYVVPKNLVTM